MILLNKFSFDKTGLFGNKKKKKKKKSGVNLQQANVRVKPIIEKLTAIFNVNATAVPMVIAKLPESSCSCSIMSQS